MAVNQPLPGQELLHREGIAPAGFVQADQAAAHARHHLGLATHHPALGVGRRQVLLGHGQCPGREVFAAGAIHGALLVDRERGRLAATVSTDGAGGGNRGRSGAAKGKAGIPGRHGDAPPSQGTLRVQSLGRPATMNHSVPGSV